MFKTYVTNEELFSKDNELRMLHGNICRLCVCDTKEEAYQQFYWITQRTNTLLRLTLNRIERQDADRDYITEEK